VATEIANLRALITELRPAALDQLGLVAALEGLAARAREVEGLETELDVRVAEDALDPDLKTAVYRLVQEALTNVGKHASATRVAVSVAQDGAGLEVRVADDGRGFDAAQPTAGFGVTGMKERAALMGGTLEIASSGAGTVVAARFPP
jgi:signal transduction histidine kinase